MVDRAYLENPLDRLDHLAPRPSTLIFFCIVYL